METQESLRIKIVSRSFDLKLYRLSKGLYGGIACDGVRRLTDCSADGYFRALLRDESCDIAINVDEDAFITDPQAVNDLVSLMLREGYANIGCADAGEGLPRTGNPKVTNPFFNILNLKLIRSQFNRAELKKYTEEYEPYYPFFLWLADHFKTLYLPAKLHPDGISTMLYNPQGRLVCQHAWYARFYSMPDFIVRRIQKGQGRQKARIDALIRESYALRGLSVPRFGAGDSLAFFGNKVIRWIIKVPQRISRWPHKIKRKLKQRKV